MTETDHAQGLLDLLRVRPHGDDCYVTPPTPQEHRNPNDRMFGGQVIAQALLAAEASLPAATPASVRPTASFHCRFLRPGVEDLPVNFRVSRDMDGGSVSHRRVVVDQGAEPILTASVMLHQPRDPGVSHQTPMPPTPSPDEAAAQLAARRAAGRPLPTAIERFLVNKRSITIQPIDFDQWDSTVPEQDPVRVWFRFAGTLPDDPGLHRAILAYASDTTILRAIDVRHGLSWFRGDMVQASLDHAIWFHEPFRADEWLLHITTSEWSGHSRGLARGQVFTQDGRLVATTTQEAMLRILKRPERG